FFRKSRRGSVASFPNRSMIFTISPLSASGTATPVFGGGRRILTPTSHGNDFNYRRGLVCRGRVKWRASESSEANRKCTHQSADLCGLSKVCAHPVHLTLYSC